ncbi:MULTISPECIES: hypothetical protein [Methylomonas]|uniref:hypothetical protein n=1 Tax=Methylomonas TaxID=416 RepID=UPI001231CF52|nr:hypothetical protein [Methylomonas rhizoryzae]
MKHHSFAIVLAAGLLTQALPAVADIANGMDPYQAGYGFDKPQQAVWGGWSRGDAGTVYAEWDTFNADGQLLAGSYGLSGASFGWNSWDGTAIDAYGNLANDGESIFAYADISGYAAQAVDQVTRVAMQLEAWVTLDGDGVDYDNIWLNGLSADYVALTDTGNTVVMDSVEYAVYQSLLIWDLTFAPDDSAYLFDLSAAAGSRIAQVAFDIAGVAQGAPYAETPVAVPLPGAVWLFLTALFGVLGVNRPKSRDLIRV